MASRITSFYNFFYKVYQIDLKYARWKLFFTKIVLYVQYFV